jgi:hypothetical protein
MIVANYMQEHCYLLLNRSMDAICNQLSSAKKITQLKERCPPYPKKIHTVHITRLIDVPKVVKSLLVPLYHGRVGNRPSINNSSSKPHEKQVATTTTIATTAQRLASKFHLYQQHNMYSQIRKG